MEIFSLTAYLAIFQRHRNQDKVPVPAQDLHWLKSTSQYRPKKGHDEFFSVPLLDRLVSISTGIVPEQTLCPGAGAAEISQKTLYFEFSIQIIFFFFIYVYNITEDPVIKTSYKYNFLISKFSIYPGYRILV